MSLLLELENIIDVTYNNTNITCQTLLQKLISCIQNNNYKYVLIKLMNDTTGGHDLYCSLNIIWVIKSRRMRWAGYVAYTGEVHTGFW
jgi:hypothetical protein